MQAKNPACVAARRLTRLPAGSHRHGYALDFERTRRVPARTLCDPQ
jgi:hypothetical protein